MATTYLTVPYKDKEAAKALGAKWDRAQRQWYVPDGRELTPFSTWLPAGTCPASSSTEVASLLDMPGALSVSKRGIPLSQLLAGVSQAVVQAFKAGVWTMVEVVDTRLRNGHVYIEVTERDVSGSVLAKSNAVIWASTASRILPEFERATGATLGPGIKLLVRARPVFKAQYGFTIEIDAIDPDYTLGDLEAKKREIRARLVQEGVFDANRLLPPPWDYNCVLVVAPQGGAGLGDFQAEAQRLEQFRVCQFTYVYSRFQGEGAASEIRQALLEAVTSGKPSTNARPDAVVIIRGGGAVNDLAWLNDYDLARCICDLEMPVLTGIGHERDSTVLDEVANLRFDTPSKVIAGIEQVIATRVGGAKANFGQIANMAVRTTAAMRRAVEQADAGVKSDANRQLALARQASSELMSELRLGSVRAVRDAAEWAQALVVEVRHEATRQLADAKQSVPALLAEVRAEARQCVRTAKAEARSLVTSVTDRATSDARHSAESVARAFQDVAGNARQAVEAATNRSQALMREIAGQGPEKTLARGFAVVRSADGRTITSAGAALPDAPIEIQFRDGRLAARTAHNQGKDHP